MRRWWWMWGLWGEAISQLACFLVIRAENAADLWWKLKWCQYRNKALSRPKWWGGGRQEESERESGMYVVGWLNSKLNNGWWDARHAFLTPVGGARGAVEFVLTLSCVCVYSYINLIQSPQFHRKCTQARVYSVETVFAVLVLATRPPLRPHCWIDRHTCWPVSALWVNSCWPHRKLWRAIKSWREALTKFPPWHSLSLALACALRSFYGDL